MFLAKNVQKNLSILKNRKELNKLLRRFQHTVIKSSIYPDDDPNKVKPIFRYANDYADRTALHDVNGEATYRSLFNCSVKLSKEISTILSHRQCERVAILCPNDISYVISQWAAWISGQIVVPLSQHHPPNMLEYYLTDSNAGLLVTTPELSECIASLGVQNRAKVLVLEDSLVKTALVTKNENEKNQDETLDAGCEPEFYQNNDAMIIYTSGTTGPPKGVVVSHLNIHSQVQGMIAAWGWCQKDTILHTLPLHHVHGITNALLTPLSIGAKVVMLPQWNASDVWSYLLAIKKAPEDRVNVFMGVPTMYSKLIQEYDTLFAENKKQVEFIRAVLSQKIRLMVSGSAPLPEPILTRWKDISGHVLLERYGMSETGMVLSNPLEGERCPGSVGCPMPGVRVRIVSRDDPPKVLAESDKYRLTKVLEGDKTKGVSGDLEVKGNNVFKYYWNKPNATAKEFTPDGWFKTGDTAEFINCHYRILGRTSVDIIKTGGFKVSALDVETALLTHPQIKDVAVVGVPDLTWGEKIAAIVVLEGEKPLQLSDLREWSKAKLAPYMIPTELKLLETIPRNQMGKINKKELVKTLFVTK